MKARRHFGKYWESWMKLPNGHGHGNGYGYGNGFGDGDGNGNYPHAAIL